MIRSVAVVIPAANEEILIGACLDAVAGGARAHAQSHATSPLEITTIIVADSCTDSTEAIARSHRDVETLPCAVGGVGAARALGVDHILANASSELDGLWIANTDADSRVPPHWLTHMITAANLGGHLVLGTVIPSGDLNHAARHRWFDRHHQSDGHAHIHGANFGIRADVYQALGGWPPLRSGEDVTLARHARAIRRYRTVRSGGIPVTTSARLTGRAPQGFAAYLQGIVAG